MGIGGHEQYACSFDQVRCQAGTYLPANSTLSSQCTPCPGGYKCPGGCFNKSYNQIQGRTQCQAGTYAQAGSSTCELCDGDTEYSLAGASICSNCGENQIVKPDHTGCDNLYTISYACGVGTGISGTAPAPHTNVRDNDQITIKDNIVGTGCAKTEESFDHWELNGTYSFSAGDTVTWTHQTQTLVAAYTYTTTPQTGCNVTFACNNGSTQNFTVIKPHGYFSVASYAEQCPPVDSDFVLQKWVANDANTTEVALNGNYFCDDTDVTLTAQWGAAPITSCNAGQYLSNGQCNDCAVGYYSNGGNVTSCTPCDPGKYASQPGSTSCSPCNGNGQYSAAGAEFCSDCDNGTVDANHTTCTPCASGMIPNANHTDCEPSPITSCNVKYACGEGSAKSGATLVYNNQSSPFTVKDVDSLCNAPNGKEFNGWNPTATAGDQYTCTGATVEFTAQWTNTTPNGTTCDAGQYVSTNGQCANCEAGYYSNGGTVTSCTPCSDGYYSAAGAESCTPCAAGTTSNPTHTDCTGNTGGGGNGTNHTCAAGSYLSANNVCTSCSGLTGYFCPGGTYTGASVRKGAYACLAGGVQNSGGASCTVVLSGDQLLKGLATGEDCWLKANIADYVNCMMTGVHNP